MTTIINADTSGGLKFTSDTSGALDIQSAGSTKLAMDSSGNVGIGTTAAATKLHIVDSLSGGQLLVANSESDNAVKYGTFGTQHYDTDQEPVLAISVESAASENNVLIGGALGEFNAATSIKFYTAANATTTTGTERMRIDSSGKVGIGTTTPDSLVEIASGGATTAKVSTSATNSYAEMIFEDGNAGYGFQVRSDGAQSIATGSMVINDRDTGSFPVVINEGNASNTLVLSGSNTCFNSTAIGFANQRSVQIQTSSTGLIAIQHLNTEVSGAAYIWFTHNGGAIGSIVQDGTSGITYNTASDYRLKENVNYSWDATTRLKQLKPARFNFISDQEKGTVDGFLAHEVSSVVPSAITGEKDAVDSDGKPIHQGIDQSKLVPLLVKTIQELEARITALEAG